MTDPTRPRGLPFRPLPAVLAAAWTVLILILCLLPQGRVPEPPPGFRIPFLDKWEHLVAFGLFALLWDVSLTIRRRGLWVALAGAAYGALIELLQGWLPIGRHADVGDTLADVSGVLLGLGLARLIGRLLPRGGPRAAEVR